MKHFTPTGLDELALIDAERRTGLLTYWQDRLQITVHKRRQPQTRADHAALAADEAHYRNLIARMQA